MQLLGYTKQRLTGFINEIERLGESEFPYLHSKAALEDLKRHFGFRLAELNEITTTTDPAVVQLQCAQALDDFFDFLPLIGVVLRSTNVRNAFEMFRPVLRLARQVLEPDVPEKKRKTKLLLSSEWDYSPVAFTSIPSLEGYLFIGLPAPESANPLLIPLAGHELGHPIWRRDDLAKSLEPAVNSAVVQVIQKKWTLFQGIFTPNYKKQELHENTEAIASWQPAASWCLRQAEESFCDCVGLTMFGESFLHAFAYLLSPRLRKRVPNYPCTKIRADRLIGWAKRAGVTIPSYYGGLFDIEPDPQLTRAEEFLVGVADDALTIVIEQVRDCALAAVGRAKLETLDEAEQQRILARFSLVVPAEKCSGVANLLNAAWSVALDEHFWAEQTVPLQRREQTLRELVLKNLEIMEIEKILRRKKSKP